MPNVIVSPTGVQGPRGNTVLSGARTPLASDGIDGDYWINTTGYPTSAVLYGPKVSGAWPGSGVAVGGAAGALLAANNLSDVQSAATSRTNLGLGSAATQASSAFDASGAASTAQAAAIADAATKYVPLTGNQTKTGQLTFGDFYPVGPGFAPGFDNQLAPKFYVDGVGGQRPWVFDVTANAYGAKGDAQVVGDGAMASGSAILASATANFASTDVGKSISVKGAGPTGVTTLITTIASRQSATQVTLTAANASGGALTGAVVIWGTDDTAAIQAAVNAAESYLAAGHTYAQVYFPPRPYIVAGALSSAKSGNGQIVFGVYPVTAVKKILEFRGEGDGAAAVRHWQQTVPQFAGSCLISFGVYSGTGTQISDINAHGNPGVISGPNEGFGYGASALYSNVMAVLKNLAIGTTHSAYGLTYSPFNFYGCANSYLENVGAGTLGTVASPSTDYTNPATFATGLAIGGLLPANGNNDHNIVRNYGIGGGYTYGLFLTEHGLGDRYMALYCWAGLVPVGNYFGSVGATHAMKVLQASIESCTHELYIYGVGSGGVGPIIDIDQLQTESGTPNVSGSSTSALLDAIGTVKLTGLFTPSGFSTSSPCGIEFVNGQVPQAISRKTAGFTCTPLDRALVCDTSGGTFTGTLPDATACPVQYEFRNVGPSTLTVATTSSQLIYTTSGGVTTFTLPSGHTLRVQAMYNGTAWGWYALQQDALPTTGGTVSGDLTVSGRLSGPIGPYGVIAPSRTAPTWRKASTSFIFQSGHGWTAVGAASSNLNNAANNPVRGTQYASITTDTAQTSANLRSFGMSAMDLTDKMVRLICRVDDVSKIATLNFFAGTSSLANNFKWTLWETTSASQLGSNGEWITITFGWSSLNSAAGAYSVSSTGVPSTTSGFTDLEVQAIGTSGNAVTLDVQAVEVIDATSTTFPNGVVSIVFDDGADSIWNYGRPAMDTYGFQGTNYVIVGNLGTATYMTTAQSKSLQDYSGWEIGLHSYDATVHNNRYTTYSAAQVDDDIRLGKQWLVSNGFRGESIAYPGGEYQKTTDGVGIDAIASRYFSTGRTILFQTGYPTESFPAGMPMRMRAVSSISSTQTGANAPANLVAAGGLLDKCQLNGGWLVLVFHKIVTGTATVSTECSQSDFQMIMAGINSRGIPVVPVSDVQRLYE